ncbi:chemotaxis protein CheX [Planctomycetales bacterium]|nr:chemotaxis protein CheX [Planctomycetales bacterium]
MSVDIDYINPVIAGLEEAFGTMLNTQVERTGLGLMENNQALYPVSGIIGVSGKGVGTIVLSMQANVAIKAAETLLMMEGITDVTDDVMDAVGELTNMVCGGAKAKLAKFSLSMSLPNILCGDNCRLHFPQHSHPISIPFKCAWGNLALQIGFTFPQGTGD